MSAYFTAADLRELADALERLTDMTQATGVVFSGCNDGEVQLNDHVMRLQWRAPDDVPVTWQDDPEKAARARGLYVVEFPDPSY